VFPRAEFGLPIIFHFQNNEVVDTELAPLVNGETKDRMGSPLILKPLMFQDKQSVPCVLRMKSIPIETVVLQKSGNNDSFAVRDARCAAYPNSPMGKGKKGNIRSPKGSALEAFMEYLKENDYTEVQR
jgi:hypothetical protein